MKNQAYRMALLFDFYGEMLTSRQKEFYDLYYNEDLSLSEIAENYDMSRQGVRDAIVRAEAALEELEEKTGIVKRFQEQKHQLEEIESLAQAARSVSADPTVSDYLRRIQELAAHLKQE
ncbi:MAG: DNA-binding protein [Oscillospiraceae bacterium]